MPSWQSAQTVAAVNPAWSSPPKTNAGAVAVPVLATPKPAQAKPAATVCVPAVVGGPMWQDMQAFQETGVAEITARSPESWQVEQLFM